MITPFLLSTLLADIVIEEPTGADAEPEVEVAENIWGGPLDKNKNLPPKKAQKKEEELKKKLKLKIGGITQFDTIFVDQTNPRANRDSTRPHFGIGFTYLKFQAEAVPQKNLDFGYVFRLAPQVHKDRIVDRNFIYIDTRLGRIEAGNLKGPHDPICKYAQRLIGGANGWDGSLGRVYTNAFGTYDGVDPVGHTGTATKLVYFSPKIEFQQGPNLQLAIGYTPNTAHFAGAEKNNQDPASESGNKAGNGDPRDIWFHRQRSPYGNGHLDLAGSIEHKFGYIDTGLAVFYMFDSPTALDIEGNTLKARNTSAWGVSGKIGYKALNFGIEYINSGKSRLPQNETFGDDAYTALENASSSSTLTADALTKLAKKILYLPGASYGHAGQAVTSTLQYRINDYHVIALGYQWTQVKLTKEDKSMRKTYTLTFDKKIREGLGIYFELDIIQDKVGIDSVVNANQILKAMGHDPNAQGNNSGILFIFGVRVQI